MKLSVVLSFQFFVLHVVAGNNQRLSNDNLYAQLKRIVKMATEQDSGDKMSVPSEEKVGILTAGNRDLWAKARNEMREGQCQLLCCYFVLQKVVYLISHVI